MYSVQLYIGVDAIGGVDPYTVGVDAIGGVGVDPYTVGVDAIGGGGGLDSYTVGVVQYPFFHYMYVVF